MISLQIHPQCHDQSTRMHANYTQYLSALNTCGDPANVKRILEMFGSEQAPAKIRLANIFMSSAMLDSVGNALRQVTIQGCKAGHDPSHLEYAFAAACISYCFEHFPNMYIDLVADTL